VLGQKHVGCPRYARYYSPRIFAPKRGVIRQGEKVKSIGIQLLICILIFVALALSIPPIPSVETGHAYDSFPNPSLFVGLVFIAIGALISIRFFNSPKPIWLFSLLGYVVFSFALHTRVWW